MKKINLTVALLCIGMGIVLPTHICTAENTVTTKKITERKKRRKKKQAREQVPAVEEVINPRYANMDMRDIADMSMDDYLRFAADQNNLKAVQDSVRATVAIMHQAMKEKHLPEDQIGMIEDIPEVDEIMEKNGKPNWLGLAPKLQKRQIDVTDTNIKSMYSRLLGGALPDAAFADYQQLLSNKKIQFRIIPLVK